MKKHISISIIGALLWLSCMAGASADLGINQTWGEGSALLNAAYVFTNGGASYWVTNFLPLSATVTKTNVTVFTTNDTKYAVMMKPMPSSGYHVAGKVPFADLTKLYASSNLVGVVTGYYKASWQWVTYDTFSTQIIWSYVGGVTNSTTNVYKNIPTIVWSNRSIWAEYTTNIVPADCLNVRLVDADPISVANDVALSNALNARIVAVETGLSNETKRVQNVTLVTVSNVRNEIALQLTNQVSTLTNEIKRVQNVTLVTASNLLTDAYTYADNATNGFFNTYFLYAFAATNTSRGVSGEFCTNSADNVINIIPSGVSFFTFVITNVDWHIESIDNCLSYHATGTTNVFQIWTNPSTLNRRVSISLHNTSADLPAAGSTLRTWTYAPGATYSYGVTVVTNSQSGL